MTEEDKTQEQILWELLEEIDAQIDLEDLLGEDFAKRVNEALWGDNCD